MYTQIVALAVNESGRGELSFSGCKSSVKCRWTDVRVCYDDGCGDYYADTCVNFD